MNFDEIKNLSKMTKLTQDFKLLKAGRFNRDYQSRDVNMEVEVLVNESLRVPVSAMIKNF